MIDIHTHYIPGVDDGSWDIHMTQSMVFSELNQGACACFATPHSYAFDLDPDEVQMAYQNLKQDFQKFGLDHILYLGCEVACAPKKMPLVLENLKTGKYPTMNNTRYVLTEFSPNARSDEVLFMAKELIHEGWHPILAHIERCRRIYDDNTIDALLEAGCLLQVNAYSFQEESNEIIKAHALQLLREKKISFLGSDAHRLNHRPPSIASGIAFIKQTCEKEYAAAILHDNARRLLLGI